MPFPSIRRRRLWQLGTVSVVAALLASGCSLLDEQERRWIFNPSKVSWNGGAGAAGMQDVWIAADSAASAASIPAIDSRLHGLWLPQADPSAPTLLYLHGARWDVRSSAGRMRRMHALGFAVLGIDYRGFGESSDLLPSETSAQEDAAAAWAWLAAKAPNSRRYVYGHSLGSAIAVRLAAEAAPANAPAGVVLEGAFTSIPDVLSTFRYGWLPLGPLVTQRFDSTRLIGELTMPVLMLHGSDDRLIPPELARQLFEKAHAPKRFLLIEGGSHHDASALATDEIGEAMQALFKLKLPPGSWRRSERAAAHRFRIARRSARAAVVVEVGPRSSLAAMNAPLPVPDRAPPTAIDATPARHTGAVITIVISVMLAALDTAIANTALPAIAADLHADPAVSVWVINAYQLATVATLLPLAALGDILGHRRIYITGLAIFTLASLACALAPNLPLLAVARAMQGLGAAGIMSVNAALLKFIYPPERLGRGLGLNALMVGMGFAAGPSLASVILSVADWPWLFGINVPIGLFALALAIPTLPRSPRGTHRFDAVAAVLNVLTFTALIVALSAAAQREPLHLWGPALVLALVFGALLLRRESGSAAPILPVDLFRRPTFALSSLTSICTFTTQGIAFVALPFYFEGVLHRSQVDTGFLITPWSIVVALSAPLAGRLSDRYPPGILSSIGLAVLAAGMASMAMLPADPSVLDIEIRMTICGAGFGFFQSPNLRALMSSAPPHRSGGASGTVATSRLLGQTTGAALTALCFSLGGVHGSVTALWVGAGFAAAASLASVLRLAV